MESHQHIVQLPVIERWLAAHVNTSRGIVTQQLRNVLSIPEDGFGWRRSIQAGGQRSIPGNSRFAADLPASKSVH